MVLSSPWACAWRRSCKVRSQYNVPSASSAGGTKICVPVGATSAPTTAPQRRASSTSGGMTPSTTRSEDGPAKVQLTPLRIERHCRSSRSRTSGDGVTGRNSSAAATELAAAGGVAATALATAVATTGAVPSPLDGNNGGGGTAITVGLWGSERTVVTASADATSPSSDVAACDAAAEVTGAAGSRGSWDISVEEDSSSGERGVVRPP
mmetsp:Transcript_26916/g.68499  ORF Transcript_26916/g.68499 Transcript_26916/m.68499 type:complete len:208 (+) Transcript_26916:646-1269(+)